MRYGLLERLMLRFGWVRTERAVDALNVGSFAAGNAAWDGVKPQGIQAAAVYVGTRVLFGRDT